MAERYVDSSSTQIAQRRSKAKGFDGLIEVQVNARSLYEDPMNAYELNSFMNIRGKPQSFDGHYG